MTTITTDEVNPSHNESPGAILAAKRKAKGYSVEYIASKLHLRIRVIQLLEADDYSNMANPVFVKGYLRAYAKLMDLDADSILDHYNQHYSVEQHKEKAPLWQSKRDTSGGERAIRWLTTVFGFIVLVAVAVWWQKNKDTQTLFVDTAAMSTPKSASEETQVDIRLTDLSKMRSLLSSETPYSALENKGG